MKFQMAMMVAIIALCIATIDSERVTGDTWKSSSLQGFSDAAINQQLTFIGQSDKRNVSGWINYFNAQQSSFGDVNVILTNSPVSRLTYALIIGVAMAVLTTIIALLFCICRNCCNCCGGKFPSKEGYKTDRILIVFALFTTFAVLILSFAAINFQFSNNLSGSFSQYKIGLNQAFTDVKSFGASFGSGIAAAPEIADVQVRKMVQNLTGDALPNRLNTTIKPAVYGLLDSLDELGASIGRVKSNFNATAVILNGLVSNLNSIPGTLNDIKSQINALKLVNVNNTIYNISDKFPDTSGLNSVELPSVDNVPDLQSYADMLNNVPDPSSLTRDLRSTFDNLIANFTSLLNDTLVTKIPSGSKLAGDSFNQLNQTLGTQLAVTINQVQADTNNIFDTIVIPFDGYRNIAMMAIDGLIILTVVLGVVGLIVRRRWLITPFLTIFILFSALVWIFFVLTYALSAPLAIVCNSYDTVVSEAFTLPGNNDSGNALSALSGFSISPRVIIDGCLDGDTLFEVQVNTKGESMIKVLEDLVNKQLVKIDDIVNKDIVGDLIDLPSPSDQLGALRNVSLDSINTTALDLAPLTVNVNLTSTISSINDTINAFTPATIDSDLGNQATMTTTVTSFNNLVRQVNPSFVDFTYTSIVNNYVIPQRTFSARYNATMVDDARNSQIDIDWYKQGGVLVRVSFIYYANQALAATKVNATRLCNSLQSLQTDNIDRALADYEALRNKTSVLKNDTQSIISIKDDLEASAEGFDTAINGFLEWALDFAVSVVKDGTSGLVRGILISNTVEGFGECKPLAESMEFAVNGVCLGFLASLSGLWYSFLLVAIFMIFGFIFGVIAKKRVYYLNIQKDKNKVKDEEEKHEVPTMQMVTAEVTASPQDDFHDPDYGAPPPPPQPDAPPYESNEK